MWQRSPLEKYRSMFRRTPGWFQWEAAAIWDALYEFHRTEGIHGDLLEIGVFRGKSAALRLPPASVSSSAYRAALALVVPPVFWT